jgi:hypothetical protein
MVMKVQDLTKKVDKWKKKYKNYLKILKFIGKLLNIVFNGTIGVIRKEKIKKWQN